MFWKNSGVASSAGAEADFAWGLENMNKLSVVINTENNEKLVADAVSCASFADEVLVVDCGSTDKTCDIAEELGARVAHLGWPGSGPLKNKAVGLARNDWVFVLKVNERITSELQAEILTTLQDPSSAGFMVARLGRYFDKDAIDQGLYPGYSLRLFNRQHGKFSDQPVLASVQLNGAASELKHHLTRLDYDIAEEYIDSQEQQPSQHYKSSEIIKAIVSPYWAFFRLYFLQRGFLDGWDGFVTSRLSAQYSFLEHIKPKTVQTKTGQGAEGKNRHN